MPRFKLRWTPKRVILVSCVLVAIAAPPALSGPSGGSAALPAGCSNRVAIAYYSDGNSAGALSAPIACANTTGYGGAETAVQIAPNGILVQEPAILWPGALGSGIGPADAPGPHYTMAYSNTSGLAVSSSKGQTWKFVEPDGARFACCDAGLYIDRQTGRLYYSAIFGSAPGPLEKYGPMGESQITSSPMSSGYRVWSPKVTMPGHIAENPRFTSAPVVKGYAKAKAGENVAYWCADFGPGRITRNCYRTLDAGASWQLRSIIHNVLGVSDHPECGSGMATAAYPQGDVRNGSLWTLIACNGVVYLAKSTDEAKTWPILHRSNGQPVTVPGAPRELRIDSAGTLYTMELSSDSKNLLLEVSRNGGLSWSGPFNVSAPAVRNTSVSQWHIEAGYQPGQIVVSYFGTRPDGTYDGYITVTRNALATNPVFYATTVNDPSVPLMSNRTPGDDWIYSALGPDGTPWAAFYSDCYKVSGKFTDPSCAGTNGQWFGGAGPTPGHATTVGHLLFGSRS